MMKYIAISLLGIFLQINFSMAQTDPFMPTALELEEMNRELSADTNLAKFISWHGKADSLYYNYKRNLHLADSIWNADQSSIQKLDIGATETFELIPLIDWFTENDQLKGENGLSYLIRTDEASILFDLGLNAKGLHPSPLMQNMAKLGISLDEIDMIVISHNHPDHIGGPKWWMDQTFSISGEQVDLSDKIVYTANPMNYPGIEPECIPQPRLLSKGVATIGVIHNPIFLNNIAEQAVAINVKDKGMVLISGCGHQSFTKIIERTDILFDEPLYALLGGFHFPMAEQRNISWIYKYFVVDKMPWERITHEDIYTNIDLLKSKEVKLIGMSGHDSCDSSMNLFKKEWKDRYMNMVVGQAIKLNE